MAQAIWYKDVSAFEEIQPDDQGRVQLIETTGWMRVGGKAQPCKVSVHPDERVQAVIRSIREANLRQSLGRARPVRRHHDPDALEPVVEVLVLSSVPLGLDIPVTSTHEWSTLTASRLDGAIADGVIPDRGDDLAQLTGQSFAAMRMAVSRHRAMAGTSVRKGRPTDDRGAIVRSAYRDMLWRPEGLEPSPERCAVRIAYGTRIGIRHGVVLVEPGLAPEDLQRVVTHRALEVLCRLGGDGSVEILSGPISLRSIDWAGIVATISLRQRTWFEPWDSDGTDCDGSPVDDASAPGEPPPLIAS
jgi:hypothetical protein